MLSTNELFKQAVLAHKGGATIKALTGQFLTILKSDVHNLFSTTPHLLSVRH